MRYRSWILAGATALLLSGCTLLTVQDAQPLPAGSQDLSRYRVVLLVLGRLCLAHAKVSENETKCLEESNEDFRPYELYDSYKGSTISGAYGNAVHGELNCITGNSLLKVNCRPTGINGLKRLMLGTDSAWQEYRTSQKKDVIEVKLGAGQTEGHWSLIVSYLTLGLVPGYTEYRPDLKVVRYDSTGKPTEIESESRVYARYWNHIVFLGWGQVVSAFRISSITDEQLLAALAKIK